LDEAELLGVIMAAVGFRIQSQDTRTGQFIDCGDKLSRLADYLDGERF